MNNAYVLTIVSALLLFFAYVSPEYCGWLVFIFAVPLFIGNKWGFRLGFVWGLCFYMLHLHAIADILYYKAHGNYRLVLFLFLVFYCAIQSGVFFKITGMQKRILQPFILSSFFIWMQTAVFWIFGVIEGYPFSLPIIPLGYYDWLLVLLPYSGVYGLTITLIYFQWLLVCAIRYKNKWYSTAVIAWISVFTIGLFVMQAEDVDDETIKKIIQTMVYIQPSLLYQIHPLDYAQEIAYCLQQGSEQFVNQKKCFILPESAYPFIVHQHVLDMWQIIFDDNNSELILGAHKNIGNKTKNCAFHIKSCRIMLTYEKNHSTPFTERTPYYLKDWYFFTHLFGGKTDRSNYSSYNIRGTHSSFIWIFNQPFYLVLCSELFFNDFLPLSNNKVPILLLCNDSWFSTNQMKNLMFLYAKIYAIRWKRPLIYISHTHATLFSKTGRAMPLSHLA